MGKDLYRKVRKAKREVEGKIQEWKDRRGSRKSLSPPSRYVAHLEKAVTKAKQEVGAAISDISEVTVKM